MCLIRNPGYSPSLTFEHDPHLHPLPGQGEEDAKRQVRVVLFFVWPVALVYKLGIRSAEESLSTRRRIEFHQSS